MRLGKQPSAPVQVTLELNQPTPADALAGIELATLTTRQGDALDKNTGNIVCINFPSFVFDRDNWYKPVKIVVEADFDTAKENDRTVVLKHSLIQVGGNKEYNSKAVRPLSVKILDKDGTGVYVLRLASILYYKCTGWS